MSHRGVHLLFIRLVVLLFWLVGLLAFGHQVWAAGILSCVGSFLAYTFMPRPTLPDGALTYARARAVIIPDWLGIVLCGFMVVLPVWAAGELPGDRWLHPMAWLLWPMALVFLSITIIGWRHEAFVLIIREDGLSMDTGTRQHMIPWDAIEGVIPWHRDLPRWMRRLVPLLVATGHPLQAGSIMIAQQSRGLSLQLRDADAVIISSDGFERNAKQLMAALLRHGVRTAPGLSHLLPKGCKKSHAVEE